MSAKKTNSNYAATQSAAVAMQSRNGLPPELVALGEMLTRVISCVTLAALWAGKLRKRNRDIKQVKVFSSVFVQAHRAIYYEGNKAKFSPRQEALAQAALQSLEQKGCNREAIEAFVKIARWMKTRYGRSQSKREVTGLGPGKRPRHEDENWLPRKKFQKKMEEAAEAIEALFNDGYFSPELAHIALEADLKFSDPKTDQHSPTRKLFTEWRGLPEKLRKLATAVKYTLGPTGDNRIKSVIQMIAPPQSSYYFTILILENYLRWVTRRPHHKELTDLLGSQDENQLKVELNRAKKYVKMLSVTFRRNSPTNPERD